MADNFNVKQFLAENKLGPYSRLKEEKFYAPSYVAKKYGSKAKEIEDNIQDEEDNNPNIWDLYTSLETPEETDEFVAGYIDEAKVKEDIGGDIGDAEAEKEMDFLAEREVIYVVRDGKCYRKDDENNMDEVNMSYCKRFAEGEEKVEEAVIEAKEMSHGLLQKMLDDLLTKYGNTEQMKSDILIALRAKINDMLNNMHPQLKYKFREEKEIEEAIDAKSFGGILKSDNPEGDALVLRFLQGIAKKFEYPVSHAAMFVKERIKKLGY